MCLLPHGSFSESVAGVTEPNGKIGQFLYNCYTKKKQIIFLGGHLGWKIHVVVTIRSSHIFCTN